MMKVTSVVFSFALCRKILWLILLSFLSSLIVLVLVLPCLVALSYKEHAKKKFTQYQRRKDACSACIKLNRIVLDKIYSLSNFYVLLVFPNVSSQDFPSLVHILPYYYSLV